MVRVRVYKRNLSPPLHWVSFFLRQRKVGHRDNCPTFNKIKRANRSHHRPQVNICILLLGCFCSVSGQRYLNVFHFIFLSKLLRNGERSSIMCQFKWSGYCLTCAPHPYFYCEAIDHSANHKARATWYPWLAVDCCVLCPIFRGVDHSLGAVSQLYWFSVAHFNHRAGSCQSFKKINWHFVVMCVLWQMCPRDLTPVHSLTHSQTRYCL